MIRELYRLRRRFYAVPAWKRLMNTIYLGMFLGGWIYLAPYTMPAGQAWGRIIAANALSEVNIQDAFVAYAGYVLAVYFAMYAVGGLLVLWLIGITVSQVSKHIQSRNRA